MNASIKLSGASSMQRRLEQASRAGVAGAAEGIERLTMQIADRARELAPVDSGALRESIRHTPLEVGTSRIVGTVTAGDGASADYAIRQHEDLSLAHPNGGGAKFLENALMQFAGSAGERIVGTEMQASVGGA